MATAPVSDGVPVCVCGHYKSEHFQDECAVGWGDGEDGPQCDCVMYLFDYEEVEA